MSDAFITRRGGGGGLSMLGAVLHVNAPVGSTISFAKGGVVAKVLGPEKSHVNADDNTTADWYYSVSPSNYGEWTVTATKDGESASQPITVDSNKQYDLTLDYNYWLVRHGKLIETFTASTYAVLTQDELYTLLKTTGNRYGRITTQSPIDITDYSTLRIKFCYVEEKYGQSYYSDYYPSIGYGTNVPLSDTTPNYDEYTRMNSASGQIFTSTFTVDASTATGPKYVSLLISGWSGGIGYVNIYDFYLER